MSSLRAEFGRIKAAIEIHAQPPVTGPDRHEALIELAEVFETHFADSRTPWSQVRNQLFAAVFDTTVELINSSRDKTSDEKMRNMIAVGGDVLSRGLTLDGLTISYFYRLVGAADTLLQMARWFGYRPGYEDLVRVWISPDVADQFRFVSDVTEELREQIREMRDLEKTPEDFGLMVRKHPETLAITAKKGVAEAKAMVISLSGRRIETTKLPAAANVLEGNDLAVRTFLKEIHADDPSAGWDHDGLAYKGKFGVSKERVADLLRDFRYDRGNLILANALHKIIRGQSSEAFQEWTVGVVGGSGTSLQLTDSLTLPNTPSRAVRWFADDGGSGSFRVSGTSARLAGSTDLARTYLHEGEDLQEPSVYAALPRPTLLIYALRPKFDVKTVGEGSHAEDKAQAESAAAKEAWRKAAPDLDRLMALKLAIPGEPGSRNGDVTYLLNGPAIDEFKQDYDVSPDDEEDFDG